MRVKIRHLLVALLGLAVVLGGSLLPTSTAQAADGTAAVSGVVVDGADEPLPGINVTVYSFHVDGSIRFPVAEASATTAADGSYEVTGLADGEYVVGFDDPARVRMPEFYDDRPSAELATRIQVESGVNHSLPQVSLASASSIGGVVTGADGAPLDSVGVTLWVGRASEDDAFVVGRATTLSDGAYRFIGIVPSDEYRVQFTGSPVDHVDEWWDDQPTMKTSAAISIGESEARLDIDAQLARGGSIAGTVTDRTGSPMTMGGVRLFTPEVLADGSTSWVPGEWAYLEMDGTYVARGLRPSVYRIGFAPDYGQPVEFWDDALTIDDATDITISTAGQAVTDIDFFLGERQPVVEPPTTPVPTQPVPTQPVPTQPVPTQPVPTEPEPVLMRATGVPKVSGKPRVAKTLKASTGTWTSTDGVKFRYQWFAGKKKIKKATKAKLKLTKKLKGKKVWVRVTASYDGHQVAVKSKPVKVRG